MLRITQANSHSDGSAMANILARLISLVAASVCSGSSRTAARTRTLVSNAIFISSSFLLPGPVFAGPSGCGRLVYFFDGCDLPRPPGKHAEEVIDFPRRPRCPDHAPSIGQQVELNFSAGFYAQMFHHFLAEGDLPSDGNGQCRHGTPRACR